MATQILNWDRAEKAWLKANGGKDLERATKQASDAFHEALDRFLATRARTIEGMRFKIEVAKDTRMMSSSLPSSRTWRNSVRPIAYWYETRTAI
jgi:hypothetical protein